MVSLWSRSAQTRMMAGTILLLDFRELELEFGMSFEFGPLIELYAYRVRSSGFAASHIDR